MKALVFENIGVIRFQEVEKPSIKDSEALIEVERVGICGTDLHILNGEYFSAFPLVGGHEFSGRIVELGSDSSVYRVGDRVTADPNISCDHCYYCRRGFFNHCRNFEAVGVTKNGAFAEYVAVPMKNLCPVNDKIDYTVAALIEPLACVMTGLRRIEMSRLEKVLIFGAGTMGLIIYIVLSSLRDNLDIALVDVKQYNLNAAHAMGASRLFLNDALLSDSLKLISEHGFDLVIDTTGKANVIQAEMQYLGRFGTLWLFGVTREDERISVSPYTMFRKEIKIFSSFAVNKTFPDAASVALRTHRQLNQCVSHTFAIDDYEKAFSVFKRENHLKIQLSLN